MPAMAAISNPAARQAQILGRIDITTPERISGWAWDQARPNEPVEVEIWLGDRLLAATRADRERPDLKRNGVGDGRHAFQLKFDAPLAEDDIGRLVAKAICPDLPQPVPLPKPSDLEAAVERIVLVPFVRLHRTLEQMAERQSQLARICETLRGGGQGAPGELTTLLHRLTAGQERLEAHLQELDIFQSRVDATLRNLNEHLAQPPEAADRPLRRAVGLFAGLTLIGFCALAALALGPLLG